MRRCAGSQDASERNCFFLLTFSLRQRKSMIYFQHADIYYRWGLLFQFISIIAAAQKNFMLKADVNVYVTQMINYIHSHIEEPVTVPDVANYVNLTRCYANTILTSSAHGRKISGISG